MCPTWGIAKIFCPRGESFVLPILQIPTSAREGGGVGLDIDRCIISNQHVPWVDQLISQKGEVPIGCVLI